MDIRGRIKWSWKRAADPYFDDIVAQQFPYNKVPLLKARIWVAKYNNIPIIKIFKFNYVIHNKTWAATNYFIYCCFYGKFSSFNHELVANARTILPFLEVYV